LPLAAKLSSELASMTTGLPMAGSAEPSVMVCTPLPGMSIAPRC